MKYLLLTLLFSFMSSLTFAQLKEHERDFAIKYLTSVNEQIIEFLEPISEEAFYYQSSQDSWSISDTFEHILVTQAALLSNSKATGSDVEKRNLERDLSYKDGSFIAKTANRGTKVKTAPPFEPSGKWDSKEEMVKSLKASHEEVIQFIKQTNLNLRKQFTYTPPTGDLDAYQIFLVIAAHNQRHLFQMEEVLASFSGS